jgi:hypothetical protein
VNRLSLGVQSFDDAKLAALGRIHDAGEARHAIDLAPAPLRRVNLDLMYALPGQSLEEAGRHRDAIASGVGHVSAYHLTLEPNTAFHHAPPPLPDDDLAADMQEVEEGLAAAGFGHYETSAFAGPASAAATTSTTGLFGDYLGIGAGAHGKLSNHERIWRETRRAIRAPTWTRRRAANSCYPANHRAARSARGIHDECAAPQRRRSGQPVHRTHRPATGKDRKVGAGGTARRAAGSKPTAGCARHPRAPLPQPPVGIISRKFRDIVNWRTPAAGAILIAGNVPPLMEAIVKTSKLLMSVLDERPAGELPGFRRRHRTQDRFDQ